MPSTTSGLCISKNYGYYYDHECEPLAIKCNCYSICLEGLRICDGECNCSRCEDEQNYECVCKIFRKYKAYWFLLAALLVVLLLFFYVYCKGYLKKKHENLIRSLLADSRRLRADGENGAVQNDRAPSHSRLWPCPSNASARSHNVEVSIVTGEGHRMLHVTESAPPQILPRSQGNESTSSGYCRSRGVSNPRVCNAGDRVESNGRLPTGHSLISRRSRRQHQTCGHHHRTVYGGGSLRIPSTSSRHRQTNSVHITRSGETFYSGEFSLLLRDAPPSYSDSCLSTSNEPANQNCQHSSRDLFTVGNEVPPPSYKEVVDTNYPLFGSFKEVQILP